MSLKHDEAFVLKSLKYGESDRIVTLFSKSSGKITGVAKGAARSRKRFGGVLEPLTEVSVTYWEKEGRELMRLDHCDLVASHMNLQKQLKYYYALSYIAEVTDLFMRMNERDEKFYRLIKVIVQSLEEGVDLALSVRYFEIWVLKLQGIFPSLRDCSYCGSEIMRQGGGFSLTTSDFLCRSCSLKMRHEVVSLRRETLTFIATVLRKPIKEIHAKKIFRSSINEELEQFLSSLFLHFIEKPFFSYKYLRNWMLP